MKEIEPSLLIIRKGSQTRGMAALIEQSGLFIAHKTSIRNTGPIVQARTVTGRAIILKILETDEYSQLVLLQALDWTETRIKPVRMGTERCRSGQKVFAALPSGYARAEIASTNKFGVVGTQSRLVQLNEFLFEAPEDQVGGALLFSTSGEFIGVVGAALKQTAAEMSQLATINSQNQSNSLSANNIQAGNRFGPSTLVVAYAVCPEILERVIEGFKSPTHEVSHPTIGIKCKEYRKVGAIIEEVAITSPARQAGIKKGDIIVELAGVPVKNQLDFAIVMLKQKVGDIISIKLLRSNKIVTMQVEVGK